MPTKIAWADETWNPVTGCTPISAGCKNCYAEAMIPLQQAGRGQEKYRNGFQVTLHPNTLHDTRKWSTPKLIFVCSMGDLFHKDVPFEFVDMVMNVIKSSIHTYELLTKRPERMAEYFATRPIPKNAWLGVTVEDSRTKYRIDILRKLNAPLRFLSCEPLLEDLGELNLENIDWVIVGGESVPYREYYKARPMKKEWILAIKRQADEQGALFYFKQWGTWGSDGVARTAKANGEELDRVIYQVRPPMYVSQPSLF